MVEGGQVFIEIQVNHSGVVQLADCRTGQAAADMGVFLGLACILGALRLKRRAGDSMKKG